VVDSPHLCDVFISYSHTDRAWVQDWLLPRLEEAGLRVCIDSRDFEIGLPSLDNMERAAENSRHTLVVLTPAWVHSEWTNFEALLTQTNDPIGRRRRVLPLMLEDCDPPLRLSVLTYADFRNAHHREDQVARVVSAIRSEKRNAQPAASSDISRVAPATAPSRPQGDHWAETQQYVFAGRQCYNRRWPPLYMVALTPSLPSPPFEPTQERFELFERLCGSQLRFHEGFRDLASGIMFDPSQAGVVPPGEVSPWACAFVDGSIGMLDTVSPNSIWEVERPNPIRINLPGVWRVFRESLARAALWPRNAGKCRGPLEVRLSLGNLHDTITEYGEKMNGQRHNRLPNRQPTWDPPNFIWNADDNLDDLLETTFASLARLLQFREYASQRQAIRAEA